VWKDTPTGRRIMAWEQVPNRTTQSGRSMKQVSSPARGFKKKEKYMRNKQEEMFKDMEGKLFHIRVNNVSVYDKKSISIDIEILESGDFFSIIEETQPDFSPAYGEEDDN
jgi:hypothetical protein